MDPQLEAILDGLVNVILNGWDDIEPIYLRCAYRLTVINATTEPVDWDNEF